MSLRPLMKGILDIKGEVSPRSKGYVDPKNTYKKTPKLSLISLPTHATLILQNQGFSVPIQLKIPAYMIHYPALGARCSNGSENEGKASQLALLWLSFCRSPQFPLHLIWPLSVLEPRCQCLPSESWYSGLMENDLLVNGQQYTCQTANMAEILLLVPHI